ncbi:hypothetical protein FRC19_007313 [Serendipita sp. 401]|nr:hypothetical protein FRC19_007313 [Serendipita sp. 401]
MKSTGETHRTFPTARSPPFFLLLSLVLTVVEPILTIYAFRSSGSIIHRVTTSFRSRHARSRRSMSESEGARGDANSFTFDIPALYPDHASQDQILSALNNEKDESGPHGERRAPELTPPQRGSSRGIILYNHSALNSVEESNSWEDGPSPQELQKSQDIVSAWLDTSMPCGPPISTPFHSNSYPEVVYETVEEEEEEREEKEDDGVPFPPRRSLRILDSISEDEVPDFVGSAVSTAPSTPMIPQIDRSRSYSPPLRRRSLEGQEEYHMRALDTIQETTRLGERYPPSPRRSLDGGRPLVLESIPEVGPTTPLSPKRRLGIKGFGLPRSESAPVIPIKSNTGPPPSNRNKLPSTSNLHLSIRSSKTSPAGSPKMKGTSMMAMNSNSNTNTNTTTVMNPSSPALPSFQRGTGLNMGQRSSRSGGTRLLDPLPPPLTLSRPSVNPKMHTLGSIATCAEEIEDEESRRLTETAFLM